MRNLIGKHNPWWSGARDIVIEKWEKSKIKWVPEWIKDISLKPFSLNFVVGPRQIGKTTGLKLLIHKTLKNIESEEIFYFNCDFTPDIHSLKKLIDTYLQFKRAKKLTTSYIFLDEITSVPEWWRIIKGYIDLGLFGKDVLTITGSSSLKLKGETELFPGRRGKGKTILVKPLSFRQFLKVHGVKIETTGNLERDMESLLGKVDKITDFFHVYLATGGFPLSINQDPTAEEQFIASFEGEILKARKNLQLTKEIISSLLRKAPSPLSFSTIGRDVGVSYKTVQDYIEVLRNLFIVDTAFHKWKNKVTWRKEKKIFFLDQFRANTLSMWCGEKYLESAMYEWIVQSHLQRKFNSIYYYRNSFEIDCIADNLKIEVKIGKPHRKYPKNVIILDHETLPLFLAVIT